MRQSQCVGWSLEERRRKQGGWFKGLLIGIRSDIHQDEDDRDDDDDDRDDDDDDDRDDDDDDDLDDADSKVGSLWESLSKWAE